MVQKTKTSRRDLMKTAATEGSLHALKADILQLLRRHPLAPAKP